MKKLLKIFVEITYETFCSFTYFVKNNLMAFANILNLIIPYAMYFIGQYVALDKNKIAVGYENAAKRTALRLKNTSDSILNSKGTKDTKTYLAKIKKLVKAGKTIPDSYINKIISLDPGLADKCNKYNGC